MENILVIYNSSKDHSEVCDYTLQLFKEKNIKTFLFDITNNDINPNTIVFDNDCYRSYKLNTDEDLLYKLGEIIDKKLIDIIIVTTNLKKVKDNKFIGKRILEIIGGGYNKPIILVPQNYRFERPKNITFLTDFKRSFNSSELREFIKIALMFDATIDIFNYTGVIELSERQNINKKDLEAYLEDLEVEFNSTEESESDLFMVQKHLEMIDSQMVVFVNHERTFFNKLINEEGIDFNSFYSKVPLLILPSINGNLT